MSISSPDMSAYPELNVPPRILLGPGPSMADPQVLKAMGTPLIGHLDPEFVALMNRTQNLLRFVFQTENQLTLPISGTGSASMEAALANTIEPGDEVLICVNGYFGLRLADMAGRYGAEVETIHRPWGEVFTADEVRAALEKRPAKIVAVVHAETSTGARQPIEEIAEVVHAYDAILIVDAVTSLSGVPLHVDAYGIDVCYSGAQKCLSIPPGISPLTLGERAVAKMDRRKTKVANWYLDLSMVRQYWGDSRTYHHTAPITMNYALYEGLRLVAQEGLENRWQRHRDNAELLWEGLEAIGVKMLVPHETRLPSLTTACIPDGVDELQIRKRLLEDYNIEISAGLGELKGKVWRIGLMGYSSRRENVLLLVSAMEKLLKAQ